MHIAACSFPVMFMPAVHDDREVEGACTARTLSFWPAFSSLALESEWRDPLRPSRLSRNCQLYNSFSTMKAHRSQGQLRDLGGKSVSDSGRRHRPQRHALDKNNTCDESNVQSLYALNLAIQQARTFQLHIKIKDSFNFIFGKRQRDIDLASRIQYQLQGFDNS